jgi:cold shock CspA family protein
MGRSQETQNKKEVRKKKEKKRQDKEQRKAERKESGGSSLDDMIAYVDEFGNISSTPPDPTKKTKVNADDIALSVPKKSDLDKIDPVHQGVVTFYNSSKGYGFIRDTESGESIFVHVNALSSEIEQNMKVSFEIERGPKGFNAVNVNVVK